MRDDLKRWAKGAPEINRTDALEILLKVLKKSKVEKFVEQARSEGVWVVSGNEVIDFTKDAFPVYKNEDGELRRFRCPW